VEIRDLRRCRTLGLVGSTALAAGGLTAGALPIAVPFYLSPTVRQSHGLPAVGMVCAVTGLTLLIGAWLRVRRLVVRRPRAALTMLMWWSAPLVLAPPLFSRDLYSYLAQGALVWQGLDPYSVGPIALGGTGHPLVAQVHPLWWDTPAPYGPVFLAIAAAVVGMTGTHIVVGVIGMRLVALAAVAGLAVAVPRLAARYRIDAGRALWLAVLNPLVLLHAVAGAHNDALMTALLVLGLLLAAKAGTPDDGSGTERPAALALLALALVAVTLAALVKAPAGLALAYLAPQVVTWLGGRWRWPLGIAGTVAVSGVTVALITEGTGIGLGWVDALGTPTVVHNGLSISTDMGHLVAWLSHLAGLPLATADVVTASRLLGAILAVAACTAAWVNREKLGISAAVGVGLGAVVLLGPVVHPWYLLWAIVPLAAGTRDPFLIRPAVALSVALSVLLLPHGASLTVTGVVEGLAGMVIGVVILTCLPVPRQTPPLRRVLLPPTQMLDRKPVPVDAKAADESGGDGGDDRVVPELLTGVDV
jgi:hypothetical protein